MFRREVKSAAAGINALHSLGKYLWSPLGWRSPDEENGARLCGSSSEHRTLTAPCRATGVSTREFQVMRKLHVLTQDQQLASCKPQVLSKSEVHRSGAHCRGLFLLLLHVSSKEFGNFLWGTQGNQFLC